jgi:hypothetical protein
MELLDGFIVFWEAQKKSRLRAFSAIINDGTPIVYVWSNCRRRWLRQK